MWPFSSKKKMKISRKPLREISIQATEGVGQEVMIESLLTGRRLNTSVPGTINAFTTYDSQVRATYDKYNGKDSFGNQQTRACVDLRTAFIAGEGISVVADNDATKDWIKTFLDRNMLDGVAFINAVKGSEIAGQSLFILKPAFWRDDTMYVRASRIPYTLKMPYRPVYADPLLKEEVFDILVRKEGEWVSAGFRNFIYTRTGGDDGNEDAPVTKVGVVLTDLENYDRAVKDMRRTNHVLARITPAWKTMNDSETESLTTRLNDRQWKIGDSFIGSAEFGYKTPGTGAHQNLVFELTSTIKTISSVTGIPVHWLGYVDLMSNRSTAETLYELIKNATINERSQWEQALYNLLIKAQELYIDNGGEGLALDYDFQVKLPLLDFGQFLERVRAYSLAYSDGAIALGDYRNAIPGIDPADTERMIEKENKEKEELMLRMPVNEQAEDEDDESEEDTDGNNQSE